MAHCLGLGTPAIAGQLRPRGRGLLFCLAGGASLRAVAAASPSGRFFLRLRAVSPSGGARRSSGRLPTPSGRMQVKLRLGDLRAQALAEAKLLREGTLMPFNFHGISQDPICTCAPRRFAALGLARGPRPRRVCESRGGLFPSPVLPFACSAAAASRANLGALRTPTSSWATWSPGTGSTAT